jgi:hypothetical protein
MGDVVVSVVVGWLLFDTYNSLSHNLLLPRRHVRSQRDSLQYCESCPQSQPPILFILRTEFARIMMKVEKTEKGAKWPVLAIVSAKSGKQEK